MWKRKDWTQQQGRGVTSDDSDSSAGSELATSDASASESDTGASASSEDRSGEEALATARLEDLSEDDFDAPSTSLAEEADLLEQLRAWSEDAKGAGKGQPLSLPTMSGCKQ
ncbi:hypothetical protein WJX73_001770 [Symbiochloris irregularis]|uniref:Uncharacterized protein n=1 Tax=Symbiochloris irregularis TaxID=706552 RepID=A0AAW1NVT8_9CHLO